MADVHEEGRREGGGTGDKELRKGTGKGGEKEGEEKKKGENKYATSTLVRSVV